MKRFLLRSSFCAALILLLALVLDPLFSGVFKRGRNTKAQWVQGMHGQQFDVAILGSSRAWWNIAPSALDSLCGLRSLSLANNHYQSADMLLMLKVFLRNGNHADLLFLEVNHSILTEDEHGFSSSAYEFLPYLDDTLVYDHLSARDDEWAVLRRVPFWRYAKYNFKFGPEPLANILLGRNVAPFDSIGGYFSPNENFYGVRTYHKEPTGHRIVPDLNELLQLCRRNSIEVVLFTSPYYNLKTPDTSQQAMQDVLHATGLPYFDLTDSLPDQRYFNDNEHINRAGGSRVTRMLVDHLARLPGSPCDGRRQDH